MGKFKELTIEYPEYTKVISVFELKDQQKIINLLITITANIDGATGQLLEGILNAINGKDTALQEITTGLMKYAQSLDKLGGVEFLKQYVDSRNKVTIRYKNGNEDIFSMIECAESDCVSVNGKLTASELLYAYFACFSVNNEVFFSTAGKMMLENAGILMKFLEHLHQATADFFSLVHSLPEAIEAITNTIRLLQTSEMNMKKSSN